MTGGLRNGSPPEDCLIHPTLFAERLLAVRASRQADASQKTAELAHVKVYRGSPSNRHQPFLYGISQRQRSAWTGDRRVEVIYRTLRYPPGWPDSRRPAQEKGIDVLLAINLVKAAQFGAWDVVVLATHDTDLEPALEMAASEGQSKVETAGWEGCRRLRPPGRTLWHTALNGAEMVKSRDRASYAPPTTI